MFRLASLACMAGVATASLADTEWGYDYDKDTEEAIPYGPEYWYKKYPSCGHRAQSPIDISTKKAEGFSNKRMPNFVIEMITAGAVTETTDMTAFVDNNGHFISVTGFTIDNGIHISEGIFWNRDRNDQEDKDKADAKGKDFDEPFDTAKYYLDHIDFHWGKSEHQVNGNHKRGEMQMFFYNAALTAPAGVEMCELTTGCFIYTVLLTRGSRNPSIAKIMEALPTVNGTAASPTGSRARIVNLDLEELLPSRAEKSYYHYYGSLSYPPCTEGISIVVAKNHRKLHKDEIKALETLQGFPNVAGEALGIMEDTYREEQDRNARVVAKSFSDSGGLSSLFGGGNSGSSSSFLG